MEFNFLPIFTFISLTLVPGHAALPPEAYWNTVLQNTPMPKVVKILLPPASAEGNVGVGRSGISMSGGDKSDAYLAWVHADADFVPTFFLEKDIKQGTKMNLDLSTDTHTNGATFLPRQVAESMPFSSNKLPEILNQFSMKSDSMEAEKMKKTIRECEEKSGFKGEQIHCATSLESMIDFCTSMFGENVQAFSTELEKETHQLQKYSIAGFKKIGGGEVVVCHMRNYAYAVFYCHNVRSTKAYMVSLEEGTAENRTKAKGVAMCHTDTAAWNPKHPAFQMLKVKPGTVPVCHFLPEDDIIWVPN